MIELIETIFSSECCIKTQFRIYCPGCGGSRATIALLQGDIIQSLKYNPIVLLFLIDILLLTFIELYRCTKKERFAFLQLRYAYNVCFLVFFVIFFVWRNYLLLVLGVDVLGDIL